MMRAGSRLLLGLAILALAACSPRPTAEVRVAGSSTAFKRLIAPLRSALAKEAGLRVAAEIKGTGAGFIALSEGRAELLLSSAELPAIVASARALGWKGSAEEAKGLHLARLHEERIIVIVNYDNPVDSLSTDNLVKIMSGRITNWREVGGKDLPIMVVLPEPGRATREVFAQQVMKGVPFTKAAFDRQATGRADDIVRVNASAIAVTGEAFFYRAHLKILDTATVRRPLLLITKGRPRGHVERLIHYLNGPGRRYWQLEMSDDTFWKHLD